MVAQRPAKASNPRLSEFDSRFLRHREGWQSLVYCGSLENCWGRVSALRGFESHTFFHYIFNTRQDEV